MTKKKDIIKEQKMAQAVELKVRGFSNSKIGDVLELSPSTVQSYINQAFEEARQARMNTSDEAFMIQLRRVERMVRSIEKKCFVEPSDEPELDEEGQPIPNDQADEKSMNLMLKLLDHEAKLHGLYIKSNAEKEAEPLPWVDDDL